MAKEINARQREIADALMNQFQHEKTNVSVKDDKTAFHSALPSDLSADQADAAVQYLNDYRLGFTLGAGEYMVGVMAEDKELPYMQASTNIGGAMNVDVTVRREHQVNAGIAKKGETQEKKTVIGHTSAKYTVSSPSSVSDITKHVAALAVTKF